MNDNNIKDLPNNPVEAQGMLIKACYKKFGKEVLPIIKDISKKEVDISFTRRYLIDKKMCQYETQQKQTLNEEMK